MAVCRVLLMRTAVGLAFSSLVACTSLLKNPEQADIKPWPEIRSDFRVESLRARLYEYSITFAAEVDLAASGDRATGRRLQQSGATPCSGESAPSP